MRPSPICLIFIGCDTEEIEMVRKMDMARDMGRDRDRGRRRWRRKVYSRMKDRYFCANVLTKPST
jgi:hypothetical protein